MGEHGAQGRGLWGLLPLEFPNPERRLHDHGVPGVESGASAQQPREPAPCSVGLRLLVCGLVGDSTPVTERLLITSLDRGGEAWLERRSPTASATRSRA